MPVTPDSVYQYRRWDEPPNDWSYTGPFADAQERLIHQAKVSVYLTAEEAGDYVTPALPQVARFRPRLGYPAYADRQARITDIINTPGRLDPVLPAYSGGPADLQASPRFESNSLAQT